MKIVVDRNVNVARLTATLTENGFALQHVDNLYVLVEIGEAECKACRICGEKPAVIMRGTPLCAKHAVSEIKNQGLL